jgi:glutathione S-transferase
MAFTIEVPNNYGYVILSCVLGQMVTSIYMGGPVMNGRKKYDVPYPNLYATPGYHKEADAFNRIQRGHQNMFELMSTFSLMALIGGLKYPIACSVYSSLCCSRRGTVIPPLMWQLRVTSAAALSSGLASLELWDPPFQWLVP